MKTRMTILHPGEYLRTEVIEPLDLDISRVADILSIQRDTLSNLLQGKVRLEPEMAWRWELAFGIDMDGMLQMQAAYDAAMMRNKEPSADIRPYLPAIARLWPDYVGLKKIVCS